MPTSIGAISILFHRDILQGKHPRLPSCTSECWHERIFAVISWPWRAAFAYCITPSTGYAQMEVWHIGKGGLSWSSQAETQGGALDVDGPYSPSNWQKAKVYRPLAFLRTAFSQRAARGLYAGRAAFTWSTMDSSTNSMAPSTGSGDPAHPERLSAQSGLGLLFLGPRRPVPHQSHALSDPNDPDAFAKRSS